MGPRSRTAPFALSLIAVTASCIQGGGRNDQIVSGPRILGVRSEVVGQEGDWADADVGDRLRLSVLIANPGNVAPLRVTWVACLPISEQSLTPCEDSAALRDPASLPGRPGVLELGEGEVLEIDVPPDAAPLLDGVIARADANPAAVCNVFVEVPLIVGLYAGDQTLFASKQLRLAPYGRIAAAPERYRYARNANPAIQAVVLDPPSEDACVGESIVTACATDVDCGGASCVGGLCPATPIPGDLHVLCGEVPASRVQEFTPCGVDGPMEAENEEPEITWYATGGIIEAVEGMGHIPGSSTLASRTFTEFTRPDGPFTLWAVIRDGRGGVGWLRQDFP